MTFVKNFCKDCLYFRLNTVHLELRDRQAFGKCSRFFTECNVTGERTDSFAKVARDFECKGKYWVHKDEKREL